MLVASVVLLFFAILSMNCLVNSFQISSSRFLGSMKGKFRLSGGRRLLSPLQSDLFDVQTLTTIATDMAAQQNMNGEITGSSLLLPFLGALGALAGIFKVSVYTRMQIVGASLISGIPRGLSVVELDAQDGKNIFYLPQGVDYTAIMSTADINDPKRAKERQGINERLILESIAKANAAFASLPQPSTQTQRDGNKGGMMVEGGGGGGKWSANIKGKVRSKIQDIPGKSVDVVLSIGALNRSPQDSRVQLVNEVYRILKPGGLFVFLEQDGDGEMMSRILSVFPKEIFGGMTKKERERERERDREGRDVNVGKKGGKQNRKNQDKNIHKSSTADMTITNTMIDVDINTSTDNKDNNDNKDNIDNNNIDITEVDTFDTKASDVQVTDKEVPRSRPGVTYERLSNIIDPYVTGIAVRPS